MEKSTEELLQFLYLSPIGLCESSLKGQINLCNAIACSYLISFSESSELNNIFDVLNQGQENLGNDFKVLMDNFKSKEGFLIKNKKIDFYQNDRKSLFNMSISLRKIADNQFMWVFQDITETTKINKEREAFIEKESFQNGQIKQMESVIHNIGNTITNLNLGIKVIEDNQTLEPFNLVSKLLNLFKDHEKELKESFKEKSDDIFSFLKTFKASLKDTHDQNSQKLFSLKKKIDQTEQIIQMYRRKITKDLNHALNENSNIHEILKNALNLTEGQKENLNIEVELALSKKEFYIEKYSTDIFQVFLNILNNAFDSIATKKKNINSFKKGLIKISSGWDSDKSSFFIAIEDNGIGFSKEEAGSLFSRGESQKENHEGIGLNYIKEVVELLHGEISLKSPGPNLGAIFKVHFPKKTKKELKNDTKKK